MTSADKLADAVVAWHGAVRFCCGISDIEIKIKTNMRITNSASPPIWSQPISDDLFALLNYERDIAYIRAENNYAFVYFINQSKVLVGHTLKTCEYILSEEIFHRCHRSYLVNTLHIRGFSHQKGLFLKLVTGAIIPVSRRKRPQCRKLFKTVPARMRKIG